MLQHLPCMRLQCEADLYAFHLSEHTGGEGRGRGEQLRLRECVQEGGMGGKRLAGVDYG